MFARTTGQVEQRCRTLVQPGSREARPRSCPGLRLLAGPWTQPGLVDSGAPVVGRRRRWLAPLARQTLELYPRPPMDRPRELATLIASLPAAGKAVGDRPVVHPVAGTRMLTNRWGLPQLDDLADLAAFPGSRQFGAAVVRRPAALGLGERVRCDSSTTG
ncbi:hypothetical protein [Nocardioides sp. B-3]|uniref:hypothetical protein n=1 Tax=Nocardioides sp. B-3 TaxID=2895565 RepID=UPI00215326DB|nr:hypothetical protein [Nocardioides sp. B-3]UUZ60673.1 hypothetical protein LP418_07600 [Nocardioides sp. B-3]